MFAHLQKSQNILIAGCGGGYDIYAGFVLYNQLKEIGKNVTMASYTFTSNIVDCPGIVKVNDYCYIVDKTTKCVKQNEDYFPELPLAKFLNEPIYTFRCVPPHMLFESYAHLIKILNIDTIVLVDGGIDSVLMGDEKQFGSPLEDLTSVIAVAHLVREKLVQNAYLYCTALYVDEPSVELFMRNIGTITRNGGFIGFYSMGPKYLAPYKQLLELTNPKSIISESIVASIEGHTGNYRNPNLASRCEEVIDGKTTDEYPFINPLTSSYWIVDVNCLTTISPIMTEMYVDCFVKKNIKNNIYTDSARMNEIIHSYKWKNKPTKN